MKSKPSGRLLASRHLLLQICGAILKHWWWIVATAATLLCIICIPCLCDPWRTPCILLCSILALIMFISTCNALTDIFSLRREEKRITYTQIAILGAIGLWIIGVVFILKIWQGETSKLIFALVGCVLTWVFQDKVKGVAAFIDYRWNGLLKIGDWIKVSKLDVDGEIQKVTLTTITLYNWDTTTSTFPISALQSNQFTNLQNMQEGKTYGRRMLKKFTIDSGWIQPIDEEDVAFLKSGKHNIIDYLPEEELHAGALNIHLYRLYLYHWLMENSHVSQQPRLMVRWIEQKDSGMVLEVYAFLTDCQLAAFEWQQSRIIEHIIESMTWFGLRLYQSPSAYDASNSNIYMSETPATYKIENK